MKICRQSSGARQVRLGFGRRGCSEAPRTTPQCQKPSKHLDGFWWFLPLGHQVYVGIQPEELDPRVLKARQRIDALGSKIGSIYFVGPNVAWSSIIL